METGAVPTLDELADRLAIQDVIATHSRGVDRADAATLKTAYWPDAEVAYGGFNGGAHEFCEMLPDAIRRWQATQHTVSNVTAEIDADNAVVESYVTAYHYRSDRTGDREMIYLGRYVDHMRKRDGVWKIMFRRVVMDWNQNVEASAVFEGPPFDGLARGGRAPEDPLYEMQQRVFGDASSTSKD